MVAMRQTSGCRGAPTVIWLPPSSATSNDPKIPSLFATLHPSRVAFMRLTASPMTQPLAQINTVKKEEADEKATPRIRAIPAMAVMAVAIVVVSAVTGVPSTKADNANLCNNGTGWCLDDWNGSTAIGNPVKAYYGGSTNQAWAEDVGVNRCGGTVTTKCPFTNAALDSRYFGYPIVQFIYINYLDPFPNGVTPADGASGFP